MGPILEGWLRNIRSARLITSGGANVVANANHHSFALSRRDATTVNESELAAFIEEAYREYARKLAGARGPTPLWFYAWFDEMAGTLDCSAAPGATERDLPFACRIIATQDPLSIARELLASPYLDGIPAEELKSASWDDDEDFVAAETTLTVFVRQLPAAI